MIIKGLKALWNFNPTDFANNLTKNIQYITTPVTTTTETAATEANTKAILENTTAKQAQAATEQAASAAKTASINSTTANTTATTANTIAEQANATVEKESVSAQALSVAGDQAETASLTANTAATVANTAAEQANAIAEQNSLAAQWLSIGSNEAEVASMLGITTATTANTVARQANTSAILTNVKAIGAWLVTNPVGWTVALTGALVGVIAAINHFTDSVEEVEERTNDLLDSYNDAISEANNNAKSIESMANRYEELSKGVNDLGQNVSLTTEEYEEYNSIVNEIADMFPHLITGYTNEGNAILSLKGNVESLRDAYKEAQQEAYNLLVVSGEDGDGNDIIKNYQNQLYGSNEFFAKASEKGGAVDAIDVINQLMEAATSPETFIKKYQELSWGDRETWYSKDVQDALESSEIKDLDFGTLTQEDLDDIKASAQITVQTYQAEIDAQLSNVESLANAYLNTNDQYKNLDEETQNAASILVNSLDENIANEFKDKTDVGAYVSKILTQINTSDKFSDALTGLFTLDEELSPIAAKSKTDSYIKTLASYLDEDENALKIRLGFEDVDDLALRYQDAISKFEDRNLDEYFQQNSINDSQELDYWISITKEAKNAAEAIKMYEAARNTVTSDPIATISDSVSQIATQLKSQFDELADAYQNIFTDKGFTLDNVDNDMLEGLRSAFADLEEDLGVDFDTTELNRFFGVLTNGESTAEEVQQAFNDLATSYLYSTDTLENLNEETASAIEQQLEEMGVTNANEVVTTALAYKKQELAAANLYAAETGGTLANATAAEIAAFAAEQIEAGKLSQEIALVLLQKANFNLTSINTEADVNNLIRLAETAGATAQTLAVLNAAKGRFGSTGSNSLDALRARKDLALGINNAPELNYEYEPVQIDFDGNSIIDDAGKAGKESADEYLEQFEKEYDLLNNLLDWGLITEKEYLDQLRALYEKYFKDREKYLEEYMKYEQEYLEGMRDLYNDVISYIIDLLDDQIDAYEEQKDAAVDALEEQRDAAIEAYEAQKEAIEEQIKAAEKQKDALQDQIDAKQDEIDAINEAAEARQREIDKQKAQYELERARNQRTKFIYRDGQMVYEADPTAIRDAEEELDDIERDEQIAAIEKEIKLLEKQQEEIDLYIERLQARQDEIDDLIDSTNDYYDGLIESTEKYWDGLIEGLEEYKSRWEELADIEEQAKMVSTIEQLGFSTENILAMSAEEFERFKEQYLGLLSDLYSSNYSMLSSIGQVAGADMFGDITGYLEQTQGYIDSLNQIDLTNASTAIASVEEAFKNAAIGAGEAANMISGTGGTTTSAFGESSSGSQGKGQEATAESSGGSGGSFKQAIEDATEGAVPLIGEVAGAFYGDEETSVTGSVEQAKTAIGTPGDSGSNSGSKGKGGKGEGEEGSDSLSGTLQSHVEYATSDEGIPAETQKFVELKDVLTEINELLTNIQTTLETLSSNTYEIKVSGIGSGLNFGGYATGVKNLKEKELAWTQEKGAEIIVSPTRNAILTPLEKGDSVINDKLTDNLLKWGTIDPSSLRIKQDYSVDFKNIPVDIQSNSNKDVAPNLTIDNVSFNCTGVTGEQVLRQIEGSFKGLFLNAYQQATTKK